MQNQLLFGTQMKNGSINLQATSDNFIIKWTIFRKLQAMEENSENPLWMIQLLPGIYFNFQNLPCTSSL